MEIHQYTCHTGQRSVNGGYLQSHSHDFLTIINSNSTEANRMVFANSSRPKEGGDSFISRRSRVQKTRGAIFIHWRRNFEYITQKQSVAQ